MKKLILVSGPSCVGKGPLLKALKHFYPEIPIGQIPVIKSHECRHGRPRPDETEIWDNPEYFMAAGKMKRLDDMRYFVGDCRGYPQAIDIRKVTGSTGSTIILEVYHSIGAAFQEWAKPLLADENIEVRTVFVSPLSESEMNDLKTAGAGVPGYLESIMIHKQLVRSRSMGRAIDNEKEQQDILSRAKDAWTEIQSAARFTDVIVNHDGEGHPNWNMDGNRFLKRPEGDAGRALKAMNEIIRAR